MSMNALMSHFVETGIAQMLAIPIHVFAMRDTVALTVHPIGTSVVLIHAFTAHVRKVSIFIRVHAILDLMVGTVN